MILGILTDSVVIGIVGTVMCGMGVIIISMIRHIWKERKEMLLEEKTSRLQRDEKFEKELKEVRTMYAKVTEELGKVSVNLGNLTGWLRSVDKDVNKMKESL